jgi:hypothetical protein
MMVVYVSDVVASKLVVMVQQRQQVAMMRSVVSHGIVVLNHVVVAVVQLPHRHLNLLLRVIVIMRMVSMMLVSITIVNHHH